VGGCQFFNKPDRYGKEFRMSLSSKFKLSAVSQNGHFLEPKTSLLSVATARLEGIT
jgi:hypothetical protein